MLALGSGPELWRLKPQLAHNHGIVGKSDTNTAIIVSRIMLPRPYYSGILGNERAAQGYKRAGKLSRTAESLQQAQASRSWATDDPSVGVRQA